MARSGGGRSGRVGAVLGGIVAGVAVVAVVVTSVAGWAAPSGAVGAVDTDPGGVTVTVTRLTRLLGGAPPSSTGSGSGACEHHLRPVIDTMVPPGPYEGPQPTDEHRLYLLSCGAEYLRPVWLRPADVAAVDPLELLEEAIRRLPIPPVTLRARPARGLTGLESRFTAEGYQPGTRRVVVEELGTRVEVEATPGATRWDFGDGSPSPWSAADAGATATHVYERTSLPGGTHRVSVTFEWAVRYRVDDGAWLDAPGITRAAGLDHPVTEARSRLIPTP